jgi:hypothetical protein
VIVEIKAMGFAAMTVPAEDQAPLIIDAERAKALQIASEFFKMVARRHSQIILRRRVVNHLKLAKNPV